MPRLRVPTRFGAALALALASACGGAEPDVAAGGPPRDHGPVPVVAAAPERRSLDDVFLEREATLYPVAEATVSTRQEGFVRTLLPEAGDVLQAGDRIAEIDPTDRKQKLEQLRAALSAEKTSLAVEQQGWQRVAELHARQIVSEEQREQQRANLDRARARVDEARARVETAEQGMSELHIFAPIPGVVTDVRAQDGEYVRRGAAIVHMKRIDVIVAVCTVSERFLAQVSEGSPAVVEVAAYPGRQFEGLVWKIVGDALVESRSFPVKVLLPNPDLALKPGMSARVAFRRHLTDAVLVPKDAVLDVEQQPHVFVVRDGKAERRDVELGAAIGDAWHARSGLAPDDLVVVTGNEDLQSGDLVKTVELPRPGAPAVPAAENAARGGAQGS
jgi:RND family efflux transporter MFP subunit